VLVAIIKKRLDIPADLYTILQILSLTLFEKTSLKHMLMGEEYINNAPANHNKLNLFDYLTGQ
jgi:hypothetical protein